MATIHRSDQQVSTRNTQPGQPESDERKLREERILDAATTLLVRWGYRKTTIDDVAHEAGVGKGTIYLHWKDKNDLFVQPSGANDNAIAKSSSGVSLPIQMVGCCIV